MTLKRKAETGIAAFLAQLPALEDYYGYQASEMKERKLPGYVIKASGEKECFPGGAPRMLQLEIVVITEVHDNEGNDIPSDSTRAAARVIHDAALAAIESALEAPGAPAALAEFLNVGPEDRPVSDFHFYDLTKTSEDQSFGQNHFADSLTFDFTCQNSDGTAPDPIDSITADSTLITADGTEVTADAA